MSLSGYTPSPTGNGAHTPIGVSMEVSHLREAIFHDLTRPGLEKRFPGVDMETIVENIRRLEADPEFTGPEIKAVITLRMSSAILDMLFFPLRAKKKITHLDMNLRKIKRVLLKGLWSPEDAVSFVMIHRKECFCKTEMLQHFTHRSYAEIEALIEHYPWNEFWSDDELAAAKALENYADRASRLNNICPLRDLEECEDLYERELQNSLSEEEEEPFTKDKAYYELLDRHIGTDLTKSGLEASFSEVPLSEIIDDIKALGTAIPLEFTKAEEHYISQWILHNENMDLLEEELIFRSKYEVAAKVKFLKGKVERKKTFKNSLEKLVYDAKWYSTFDGENSRRARRAASLDDVEVMALADRPAKKIKILTPEEQRLREERRALRAAATEKSREEKRLLYEKRKEAAKNKPPRTYNANLNFNKKLLIDAEYFQTVTGNRKKITAGDKRERRPAVKEIYIIPEFKTRQKLKRVQRNLIKASKKRKQMPKKHGRPRKYPKGKAPRDDTSDEEDTLEKLLQDQEELSPGVEEDISPFDPTSILQDTQVPLHSRRLYADGIYQAAGQPPLEFGEYASLDGAEAMLNEDARIPFVDVLGFKIIVDHIKSYHPLPSTFPPVKVPAADQLLQINVLNRVRVRNLLYPQHTELYLLAQPKSNELDPIFEIQKIFQIHYALYFSHSETLKRVIYDEYCAQLGEAIAKNDFAAFMFVIDKWNCLMVELCPYETPLDPSVDINPEIRAYLPQSRFPTREDLSLSVFFNEWEEQNVVSSDGEIGVKETVTEQNGGFEKNAGVKKEAVDGIAAGGRSFMDIILRDDVDENGALKVHSGSQNGAVGSNASVNGSPYQSPTNGPIYTPNSSIKSEITRREGTQQLHVQRMKEIRSPSYSFQFLSRLRQKTSVSRFCMQQLLLRAYIRVVSPDLRKLRSYKAFTAEVYGELLPSFVSEVLTKVNLLPTQKFYDLGSGVGNTTLQAALEFGAAFSGGCEIMEHASHLTQLQVNFLNKQLAVYGLQKLPLKFALLQSFVGNKDVLREAIDCDVFIINNYLFDFPLNVEVGKLLHGLKPGTKIISLRNFIPPRYKVGSEATVFDYLSVEKHEMSDFLSVSWTANKVPYYISTVEREIRPEYL